MRKQSYYSAFPGTDVNPQREIAASKALFPSENQMLTSNQAVLQTNVRSTILQNASALIVDRDQVLTFDLLNLFADKESRSQVHEKKISVDVLRAQEALMELLEEQAEDGADKSDEDFTQ